MKLLSSTLAGLAIIGMLSPASAAISNHKHRRHVATRHLHRPLAQAPYYRDAGYDRRGGYYGRDGYDARGGYDQRQGYGRSAYDGGPYGGGYRDAPFRTVAPQPSEVGAGIAAPNGYRGFGSASGGPAGGIDTGGGR